MHKSVYHMFSADKIHNKHVVYLFVYLKDGGMLLNLSTVCEWTVCALF